MGWIVLRNKSEVLAIHAALLHTGEILYFSGDEHDKDQNSRHQIDHTRLFDTNSLSVRRAPSPGSDVFCSGHAFLIDGRLLVAGGTSAFPRDEGQHATHFPGLRDAWVYDPATHTWTRVADMNPEPGRTVGGGRWYPTLLTLPNGQILTVSGHPMVEDSRHNNDSPEKFSPSPRSRGTWRLLTGPDPAHAVGFYPRLHVLPNGQVLFTTQVNQRTLTLDPNTGAYHDLCPAPPDGIYGSLNVNSVLLPLRPSDGYRARVLVCGGHIPYLLDMGNPSAGWQPTGPRALAGGPVRLNCSSIILPTGMVFVCGGVVNQGNDNTAVRTAELYNPTTNSWSVLETATVTRNYHSVALLMPDGRVWTCGSNKNGSQSYQPPGQDNRELRIEIYEPSYVHQNRPRIGRVQRSTGWGRQFDIETQDAPNIARVVLVKAGSVTHAFNSDQRYVEVTFHRKGGRALAVTAPPTPAIAPPGYYLAFLLNQSGVPSVGKFVRLAPAANSSGWLIQSNYGSQGNFEVVVPTPGGGLRHCWRDNNTTGLPWHGPTTFASDAGTFIGRVSLLQGNYGSHGNFEVVGRVGSHLVHLWRDSNVAWHIGPTFANNVSGSPALIQGIYGGRGNFELVAPLSSGGIAHWWRNNDAPGNPWSGGTVFATNVGVVSSVALIQSNYGNPGNLEVVARIGNALHHFYRDETGWHQGVAFATGVRGEPAFIQSRFGNRGNFEVIAPLASGGLGLWWRENDAAGLPWHGPASFGDPLHFDDVTLIQSNFGSPLRGNFEVIARSGATYKAYWRNDSGVLSWAAMTPPPF
ncbi:uncharacterized protein VTP21DRAFT_3128 [Calcarisporiella thermophila]|uniref:uncharacterized protein n=1 Tax=Calcarisporiella thermophila TaxID=911321 RepID=UPI003743CA41